MAARSVWLFTGAALAAAVCGGSYAQREYGRAVLFALQGLSRGEGLSGRDALLGRLDGGPSWPGAAAGPDAVPQALCGGPPQNRALGVGMVSHALELRHAGFGVASTPGQSGVDRNDAPMAARPGVGVEA